MPDQITYLSTLPAANVDILQGILQGPLVPLPASEAERSRGVPLEQLGGDGAPHVAGELGLLERQWSLREAKGVAGAISRIGLGCFLEDLRKDFVGELVDVH